MSDEVRDTGSRMEIDGNGRAIRKGHETRVVLARGLMKFFTVGGDPVAVEGSAGDNASADHTAPKEGQVLVPLRPVAAVARGVGWFTVGGKAAAVENSPVRVPDAEKPEKCGVLRVAQGFFRIGGEKAARGAG